MVLSSTPKMNPVRFNGNIISHSYIYIFVAICIEKDIVSDQGQSFAIYTSPERMFCQKICGWGFTTPEELTQAVQAFVVKLGRLTCKLKLIIFFIAIIRSIL